ncbi:lethal(2) giant larvae protein homolog 1 [Protopterus annectens]|uniref:lethal(2) giant larvae protein homolog 1 n=1 Tax=Protopterus annectens TaxID=7888 RepID=UPI001CFBF62F|nr:lethal(2) giant larvae protein homolog 1 [Protopterus annectens]
MTRIFFLTSKHFRYGAPGVEFTGLHKDTATVMQMHFLPGQGQLLSMLDDNTLHFWEINLKDECSHLEEICSYTLPGRPGFDGSNNVPSSTTRITVILLKSSCDLACLGTEGGGVYFLKLPGLTLSEDKVLFQDEVMQSVPDDYRSGKALGPVESLQEHPQEYSKILIGYSRGLVVLWDQHSRRVDGLFLGNQVSKVVNAVISFQNAIFVHFCLPLTLHMGSSFTLSEHIWRFNRSCSQFETLLDTVTQLKPSYSYNNAALLQPFFYLFFCCDSRSHLIIFSGGMPRASYGDRHCVTVLQGKNQVTMDFTSRVIDFFTVHNTEPEQLFDNPSALVVLVEEELVVIDLQTPGWPTVHAPYLAPLHSSAITCSYHISNVPDKLWEKLISVGEQQNPHQSTLEWPINGGKSLATEPTQKSVLLTGHEDGTVRFWDASGVTLRPIYRLNTSSIFHLECDHNDSLTQASEEEWPPFRKVGCFDPYSDDPRLGIQKISLCKYTGKMVVAGTAGQVLVMEINEDKSNHMLTVATVDLLQDREGFTWKGHDRLTPKNGPVCFLAGFQPSLLIQCTPPAAVTSVALHTEWNLVAFGTSHGFGLFDYYRRSPVLARGFYLISPSEFERFSLSARNFTEPLCIVECDRVLRGIPFSNSITGSPKLNQVNGTYKLKSPEGNCLIADGQGVIDEFQASFSPVGLDSPNSSGDIMLDASGDITVEDVKDYLVSSQEAEKNLKNMSDDEARSPGILIK